MCVLRWLNSVPPGELDVPRHPDGRPDPGWLQVSQSLGATRREQLTSIVLPGIRAHLATGLRVALGTAWIVIVPAEMLGVGSRTWS